MNCIAAPAIQSFGGSALNINKIVITTRSNVKISMIRKDIKTVLFASLIAAMILPFSGMQFAVAEEQIEIPKNLDDKKYFIQDQAMEALQNMTEAERAMYFAHMGEYLKNRTPGQIQLDIEIEKLSYIVLQDKALMGEKYDPMNPSKQAQEQFAVIQDHPMVKGAVELEKFIEKVEFEKAQALKTGVEYEERAYSAEELGINLKEDTTSFQSSSHNTTPNFFLFNLYFLLMIIGLIFLIYGLFFHGVGVSVIFSGIGMFLFGIGFYFWRKKQSHNN